MNSATEAFVRCQEINGMMRLPYSKSRANFFHVAGFTRIPTAIHIRNRIHELAVKKLTRPWFLHN